MDGTFKAVMVEPSMTVQDICSTFKFSLNKIILYFYFFFNILLIIFIIYMYIFIFTFILENLKQRPELKNINGFTLFETYGHNGNLINIKDIYFIFILFYFFFFVYQITHLLSGFIEEFNV